MDIDALLCVLERFQTVIIGFVGFGGVILTLIANARLSARGRKAVVQHEQQVLKVALIEELKILRETFKDRIEIIDEAKRGNTPGILVPVDSMTSVYDQHLSKLGLLTSEQTQAVMRAYLSAKQIPTKVGLLAETLDRDSAFISIGSEYFETVEGIHKNTLPGIEAAIASLEDNA